jgi:hypothetical protein
LNGVSANFKLTSGTVAFAVTRRCVTFPRPHENWITGSFIESQGLSHRRRRGAAPNITTLMEEKLMITRILNSRYLALCLTLAFLAIAAQVVLPSARAQEPMGLLTITGKVKVNGQPAATGDIFSSGGTIETAKGSSAVVSLGKLGRVEALPESRIKLRYDDSSISILIEAGNIRLSTGPGVAANISSKAD